MEKKKRKGKRKREEREREKERKKIEKGKREVKWGKIKRAEAEGE